MPSNYFQYWIEMCAHKSISFSYNLRARLLLRPKDFFLSDKTYLYFVWTSRKVVKSSYNIPLLLPQFIRYFLYPTFTLISSSGNLSHEHQPYGHDSCFYHFHTSENTSWKEMSTLSKNLYANWKSREKQRLHCTLITLMHVSTIRETIAKRPGYTLIGSLSRNRTNIVSRK